MNPSIQTEPASRHPILVDDARKALTMSDARALCKMSTEEDLVDTLKTAQLSLKAKEDFLMLLGEQMHRLDHAEVNLEAWHDLLGALDEWDHFSLMCPEEQRIHASLDAEFDLYGGPNKAGNLIWWHLHQADALRGLHKLLRAVKARARRQDCIVQLRSGSFCIFPIRLLDEGITV